MILNGNITYDKSWGEQIARCSIRILGCKLVADVATAESLFSNFVGLVWFSLSGLFCFSTFPVEFVRQLEVVVGILVGILGNNKVESTFCKIWKHLGRPLGVGDL